MKYTWIHSLRKFWTFFTGTGLRYWLDSGTLLGLVRDGELLPADRDLDFSVWAEEEAKIRTLLPEVRQKDYHVFTASYRGRVFKYNFVPRDLKNLRTVISTFSARRPPMPGVPCIISACVKAAAQAQGGSPWRVACALCCARFGKR